MILARLIRDRSGATAIEYALLAALVAGAIVSAATLLGSNILVRYEAVAATTP